MPNLERRAQAFEFFRRMGWSREQSAGLVANLEAESGLRPDAVGDGGQAYGIAQWHPDRQQGFAALMGKPIQGSSFEDQLAWVHAELQGTEKPAGDRLRACTTAEEAADVVCRYYERPADKDGEARKRAALAAQILASAPQIAADLSTPQPQPETPQRPEFGPVLTFGGKMLPLLLPAAIQLIPQLIAIFGKGGERAQQNAQAAQAVADAVVRVTGAPNLQGGIEAMQANPEVKAQVAAAVLQEPAIAALLEVGGGGIEGARKFAAAQAEGNRPWWTFLANASFWVALFLTPLLYLVTYRVLWDGTASEQLKTVVVTAILSGLLGALTGFFFGSAYTATRTTRQPTSGASQA